MQKQAGEENAVTSKFETRARKIAEPFFSLASRPASYDKSASNSSAKATGVGMGRRRGVSRVSAEIKGEP